MNYLSICAIVKDEHPVDLCEWVAFHLQVGVEKFTVYDNQSVIPVIETLRPYSDKGLVDVVEFPGKGKQMPAYDHYLHNFGNQTVFAGVIDADEYLVPQVKDSIPAVLEEYEAYGGLGVSWRIFGSNGHLTKPNGLLIENFTQASPKTWHENSHIKSIVQPAKTRRTNYNPHSFLYQDGFGCVSEDFKLVKNAWTAHCSEKLRLNHYFTKSREEFELKVKRGRADVSDPNIKGRSMEDFENFDRMCVEEDLGALRFLEGMKARIL
jgi:Glycosyltransferase family 92